MKPSAAAAMPDIEELAEAFETSLAELVSAARQRERAAGAPKKRAASSKKRAAAPRRRAAAK